MGKCEHKLQYRSERFAARRRLIRKVLVEIAERAPDPFTLTQAMDVQECGLWPEKPERWASMRWLVHHGFIKVAVRVHSNLFKYELSEQAIRWLDWTGFEWSSRKVA